MLRYACGTAARRGPAPGGPHHAARNTPRRREVLQLVAEGHTTKEIDTKLGVTVKTAEAYRGELMKALDVHNIASLTRHAIRTGLVSLDA
ncbi:MAG TPA: LuxR C-terminal-related transcriptional regulator [Gemmatimonadales bacterium]|nr:LuxR C-terminal-related transcriptional regulator [Gemmatimonadales bacterium]